MGLFDKKLKRDDFDSPVEEISLSKPMAPVAAAPAREPERDVNYGINKAIELMRLLPTDNIELVVKVVKTTLESTQIRVATIVEDASRKQKDIQGRIAARRKEIAELEAEIATRRQEIDALETDHAETTSVKERLILAERLAGGEAKASPPPAPPAAHHHQVVGVTTSGAKVIVAAPERK